jgi:hypothetical protein
MLWCNGDVDVSAAGTGSPILDSLVRLDGPAGPSTPTAGALSITPPGVSDDSVGHLLQRLSAPQIHHLLDSIDAKRFPQDAAVLEGLLQTAGSAAARHDVPRALAAVTEYVNRNPEHASALATSPLLSPIQGDVRELVHKITMDAKTEAIRLMGAASELVDGAARHPEKLDGPGALAIAEQLAESGQLVNYFRAAELSQAVIAFYSRTAPEVALDTARGAARKTLNAETIASRQARRLGRRLWKRVPLLVLLMGWMATGAVGGVINLLARAAGLELVSPSTVDTAFEFWGVGFLALVILQFWITVRNIPRR